MVAGASGRLVARDVLRAVALGILLSSCAARGPAITNDNISNVTQDAMSYATDDLACAEHKLLYDASDSEKTRACAMCKAGKTEARNPKFPDLVLDSCSGCGQGMLVLGLTDRSQEISQFCEKRDKTESALRLEYADRWSSDDEATWQFAKTEATKFTRCQAGYSSACHEFDAAVTEANRQEQLALERAQLRAMRAQAAAAWVGLFVQK
jgi:hypothetical protein